MKRRHHTLNQLMVQIKLKLHKRLRLLSRPVPCALQQRTTAPQLLCNSPSPKMSSKPYCSSCFFCSSKSRCSLGSPTEQQPPKDGVVLGADTRATQGPIVADRNCEKIHYMAPNIYCYGAGTAADTEAVTGLLRDEEMLQPSIYLNKYVSFVLQGLLYILTHCFVLHLVMLDAFTKIQSIKIWTFSNLNIYFGIIKIMWRHLL
ncbi:hypothetical protein BS78_07G122700 [Paspalum vaginatum]|nr:hypothetical protein BS78_07G122700 [Paspalum vaginatum]KAJ1268270.1 hypothetical protein BS78_07G122700 [Paspalum vaginatum]KAJ1268271.1 hypothetical protein BS78_07G122700 [Paspalum vaginatum]KAJ1268272.1 hypothetical protein BS78_07G122700 [Paspalum vaginatum]